MLRFRQSKRRAARFLSMILQQPDNAGCIVTLQNPATAAVEPGYDELPERLAGLARERPGYYAETLTVSSTADGQVLGGPEEVGDCRGIILIDDATLALATGSQCFFWSLPGRPQPLASFPGNS